MRGRGRGGREIYAELLDESEEALWKRDWIESARVREAPELVRVVVAVDPAVSSRSSSAETGIVVAGVDEDRHAYVLEDASGRMSPDGWARRAIGMLDRYGADRIVGESNNGGDLVEHTIRTAYEGRVAPYKVGSRESRGSTRGRSRCRRCMSRGRFIMWAAWTRWRTRCARGRRGRRVRRTGWTPWCGR